MKISRRLVALLLALVSALLIPAGSVSASPEHASFEKLQTFTLEEIVEHSTLPVLNIMIENGEDVDREDKTVTKNAEFEIHNSSIVGGNIVLPVEDGVYPMTIHGRGNSSWTGIGSGKKSYKIKFESGQNLLGLGKAKSWCLISNWADTTYMRNYVAYKMAASIDCLAPDCMFVDLCINGVYEGIYLLTESINLHEERVKTAGDGVDKNGDGVISQYLLEARCDWAAPGFYSADIYFNVKDTEDGEDPVQEDLDYLTGFINDLDICIKYDINYDYYMDVASFIDCYLINEALKNPDYGFGYQHYYASTYCYMEEGGKLWFGPVWDFDICLGRNHFDVVEAEEYRETIFPTGLLTADTKWVKDLLKHDKFEQQVADRWAQVSDTLRTTMLDSIEEATEDLAGSVNYDIKTWGGPLGRCTWYNFRDAKQYDLEVEYITDWGIRRFDWMDEYWLDYSSYDEIERDRGFWGEIGYWLARQWYRLTK